MEQEKCGTYGGMTEYNALSIGSSFLQYDPPDWDGLVKALREAGCTSREVYEICTKCRNGDI